MVGGEITIGRHMRRLRGGIGEGGKEIVEDSVEVYGISRKRRRYRRQTCIGRGENKRRKKNGFSRLWRKVQIGKGGPGNELTRHPSIFSCDALGCLREVRGKIGRRGAQVEHI